MMRFHGLENALHAREGSTTLIATVFSSASIILLGGYILTLNNSSFSWVVAWSIGGLGFVFPILGEVYRELTIMTIDAADLADLREFLTRNQVDQSFRRNATFVTRFKSYRRGSIRFLLLIPSSAWIGVALGTRLPIFMPLGIVLLLFVVHWLNSEEHARKRMAREVKPEEDENPKSSKPSQRNAPRALYIGLLLGALLFLIGLLVWPYFPQNMPVSSATAILQSMIQVNGVLFAFSAVIIGILASNPARRMSIQIVFIYLFAVTLLFLFAIFFDVIDLANVGTIVGTTIGKAEIIRDVLFPVLFGFGFIYLSSEVYRQANPNP